MFGSDVIEFSDPTNRTLVARYPATGEPDIAYGAQLNVQQSQEAVFVRDGKAMDILGPGRHRVTTDSLPLVSRLLSLTGSTSSVRALVYFVGKQTFVDQRWGTRQPIAFRDRDSGSVRLRSFGRYSMRVVDSAALINSLVGTRDTFTTTEVSDYLRDVIVSGLTDLLGTMQLNLLDISARFDEIASSTRAKVAAEFRKYGLELVDFFINSILPPDDTGSA